ncbi:MAG: sulfotransferase [Nitrospirales bacterium]
MKRIATVVIERPLLRTTDDPNRLCPLMVTSVGRSGSTLLMQLLGAHPEVAVRLKYPMETTFARKKFHGIIDGVTHLCQTHVKSCPSIQEAKNEIQTKVTAFIDKEVLEIGRWYQTLHYEQSGNIIAPKYFAEKNLSPEWFVWEACPNAKEIFLVRDPRDMICSSLAFNRKRGRLAFGRQDVGTDLEYVAHRASMMRPWVVEPWLARRDRSLLVRYEELILNGPEVLMGIFQYLGIEATPSRVNASLEAIEASGEIAKKHSTTEVPFQSIGRWRSEMSSDMISVCNKEFVDFLSIFKYPLE